MTPQGLRFPMACALASVLLPALLAWVGGASAPFVIAGGLAGLVAFGLGVAATGPHGE